jgi:hypothetical protein
LHDAPVDLIGKLANLSITRVLAVEVTLEEEHAGEQERRIYRRDLAAVRAPVFRSRK